MNVGDTVRLSIADTETFRVVGILGATQLERGPLLLRLKSKLTGRTIYDYPSSLVTKEEQ